MDGLTTNLALIYLRVCKSNHLSETSIKFLGAVLEVLAVEVNSQSKVKLKQAEVISFPHIDKACLSLFKNLNPIQYFNN